MTEFRDVKKYTMTNDLNLNKAYARFERFMSKTYGKKKYTVLLDSFLPSTDDGRKSIYSVLFEFKNAKLKSNVERVKRNG